MEDWILTPKSTKMNKIGMDLVNFTLFICVSILIFLTHAWAQIIEWRQRDVTEKANRITDYWPQYFEESNKYLFFISFDAIQ